MPGSLSTVAPEMLLLDQIFTNVPSALDSQLFTEDQLKLVENSVLQQSQDLHWYVKLSGPKG